MSFSVRIVDLDFYMSAPVENLDVNYSKFRGSSISQVPVLRLFGTTLEGQKICLHIHGVFPYLYIPYDGSQEANGLMYRIASLIDKSINVSLNQGSSNTQHVYKISLVSGIPMYGYHSRPHQFLKICLYNPIILKKLSNLLMNESTLGQIYQPHETHLNFTLQFMMDYNLHGMSFMNLSEIKFRRNLNQKTYGIADDLFLPLHIKKTTVCELEADVLAQNITNREQVTSGHIAANPGILCLWEDERQRRIKNGNTKELEHLLELTRVDVEPTKSHSVFKQALRERLAVFSSEQNTVSQLNSSVYPAETPENLNVQPASDNDSDISSSLELSLDDTVCDLDATMTNESSMMEEDRELFNILNKLGDSSDDIEDDSILSQAVKINDEEPELDMTLPLEKSPVGIPCKSDDEFDEILIPQLDGECDDVIENSSQENYPLPFGSVEMDKTKDTGTKKPLKKAAHVKLGRENATKSEIEHKMVEILENMDPICLICRGRLLSKKKSKKPFKRKVDVKRRNATELKIFSLHMKRMKNRHQLSEIIRKIHEKERRILIHISRNGHPLFRVVSSRDQRAPYITKDPVPKKEIEKINTLSDVLLSTQGYVEPSLHIIVKFPNDHSFLYTYKNTYPEVTDLPEPPEFLCEHKKEEFLLQIIKLLIKDLEVMASPYNSNFEDFGDLKNESSKIEDQKLEEGMEIDDSRYFNDLPTKNEDQDEAEIKEVSLDMPNLEDYGDLDNVLSKIEEVMEICPDLSNFDDSGYFNDSPTKNDDQDQAKIVKKCLDMPNLEDSGDQNNVSTKIKGVMKICPNLPNSDDSGFFNDSPTKNYDQDQAEMMEICPDLPNFEDSDTDESVDNCDKNNQKIDYTSQKYLCDIKYKKLFEEIKNKTVSERNLLIENIRNELVKHIKILNTLQLGHSDQTENDINLSNINIEDDKDTNSKDHNSNLIVTREDVNISLASEVTDTGNMDCDDEINKRKKRRPLLFIDGANDTSSEDEDFIPMTQPQHPQSSVSSSSTRQKKRKRITSILDNDSGIETSKYISTSYCDPGTSHSPGYDLCKPGTSQTAGTSHSINATVVEEKRACAFKSALNTKTDLIEQTASISHNSLRLDKPSTSKDNFLEETHKSYLSLSCGPQQDDLEYFSSASEEEIEHFEEFDAMKIDGDSTAIITPQNVAPTVEEVVDSLSKYGIPHVRQQEPFFSNPQDVGGSIKLGFTVLKVNAQTITHLQEFETQTNAFNNFRKKIIKDFQFEVPESKAVLNNIALSFCNFDPCVLKPVTEPPTPEEVKKWVRANQAKEKDKQKDRTHKDELHVPVNLGGDDDMDISLSLSLSEPPSSQKLDETPSGSYQSSDGDNKQTSSTSSYNSYMISGVSLNDTYAFRKPTEDLKEVRVFVEHQHITVMVMELHVLTRGDFKPDPLVDPIQAIFFSIFNDVPQNSKKPMKYKGAIVMDSKDLKTDANVPLLNGLGVACDIFYVQSEEELFKEFTRVVNFWDPDIVAGYEIEMASWGYLIERGAVLQFNMKHNLGRNSLEEPKRRGEDHPRELKLIGRIVLDVWRLMRHEIALQSYTFESVVYNILRKRVPYYAHKTLTSWWNDNTNSYRHRVVKYYLLRVDTVLELFDKLDFINRTSELARLFGILFYEVLSRGSQFRVESMMLRLAKPLNFIPVSPSTQQRAHMKAPEYISLVLEPESKLYNDPVIVLDFQSLYPSLIIAYNYCFTTCLGRVENLGKNGPFEFGATQLRVSRKRLEKLLRRDLLNFSPCGVAFVKKAVRDGIMPRMLREILDTRLMVKNSMKENKNDHNLQKVLHNRQLGLKLIANVTYGYTAANFSGRMPAVELGDSVVSKGRETLQRAIELVENTPEWEAKVVYGDTDSLFVMVPGRSREHAFEIGAKIADAVTKSNPDPVKLKLEKVYQPCILQTKKRYVGYMYESPDQKEPVYEAKGIETVRRDGIPATTKMLEKCLRILFETKDVSLVKKYVIKQFTKILTGRASMQDLTFAKEYRGATGYQPGACVPALELARKWRAIDRRNEPRSGERVPYVIVHGPPDVPLIRLVRSPRDLLNDCFLKYHAIYYITKAIIPPINRCFNLIGVDLFAWFNDMQRKKSHYLHAPTTPDKKSTISQYFVTTCCVVCGVQTQDKICKTCNGQDQLQNTTLTLMEKLKTWEENYHNCVKICQSCTSCQDDICCVSLDCPVLYRRVQTNHDLKQESYVRQLIPPDISF